MTSTSRTVLAAAALAGALVLASCSGDAGPPAASPSPGTAASSPSADVTMPPDAPTLPPFGEPTTPATPDADVPARMYAVLADQLDPRGERLAAYDGSNDAGSGVGAGKVRGGWSMNAAWDPQGLVGLVVSPSWPDGWVCLDNYPGCRDVAVPGGGTARALPAGRNELSVGYEQPDGDKVIASAFRAPEVSAQDLAAVVGDPRLGLD